MKMNWETTHTFAPKLVRLKMCPMLQRADPYHQTLWHLIPFCNFRYMIGSGRRGMCVCLSWILKKKKRSKMCFWAPLVSTLPPVVVYPSGLMLPMTNNSTTVPFLSVYVMLTRKQNMDKSFWSIAVRKYCLKKNDKKNLPYIVWCCSVRVYLGERGGPIFSGRTIKKANIFK